MKQVLNRIDCDTVEIYTVDNFLSPRECDTLIRQASKNAKRSLVIGDSDESVVNSGRTSKSAAIDNSKSNIVSINKRINRTFKQQLGEDPVHETLQLHVYGVGEEYTPHYDFFPIQEGVQLESLGQRSWTCLLYLNDDFEGGETEFPNVGVKIKPKRGRALLWNNLNEDGTSNPDTLHAGLPVISGAKFIVTRWGRTGSPIETTPTQSLQELSPSGKILFKTKEELPRLTEKGYFVEKIPHPLWQLIKNAYQQVKEFESDEGNLEGFIESDKVEKAATIMSLDNIPEFRDFIHDRFRPFFESLFGAELENATFYGIRSYHNGATLAQHTDRVSELHASGIILVDQDVNKPWPLQIQGHDGEWESITIEPGEIIIYESAICSHGRTEPLEGSYFNNCFIHYKYKNYEYRE